MFVVTIKVVCSVCDKSFSSNSNLRIHLKNVHHIEDKAEILARTPSPLSSKNSVEWIVCKIRVHSQYISFKEHFATHNIQLEKEEILFTSLECFNQWKSEMEKKDGSQYLLRKTDVSKKFTKTYYECNRSGFYKPQGIGIRHLKTQGSKKINGHCPLTITLECGADGTVKCCFVKTHVGHDMNLEHLNLSKECKFEIAEKLAQNIPEAKILHDFRDNCNLEDLCRDTLLTKKDIRNVRTAFNINHDGIRDPNDTLSVDLFVSQDRESVEPCVLFYKREGQESPPHPSLGREDFIIIIMNAGQSEILRKYGSDFICMDSTRIKEQILVDNSSCSG